MSSPPIMLSVAQFQHKWQGVTLKERSACAVALQRPVPLLGVPTPTDADPTGSFYTFERGAEKTDGGARLGRRLVSRALRLGVQGPARRPEQAVPPAAPVPRGPGEPAAPGRLRPRPLRGPHQLHRHRQEGLCLLTGRPRPTRAPGSPEGVWTDPNLLRPDTTPEAVTKEAAERFGHLSASLQARGVDPHQAAHFLVQRLFCLFAEDVGLLPKGLFKDLLARSVRQPERFASRIEDLLTAHARWERLWRGCARSLQRRGPACPAGCARTC